MVILFVIIFIITFIWFIIAMLSGDSGLTKHEKEMFAFRLLLKHNVPDLDGDINRLKVNLNISKIKTFEEKKKWVLKHYLKTLSPPYRKCFEEHGATALGIINELLSRDVEAITKYGISPKMYENRCQEARRIADNWRFPEVIMFGYLFVQTLSVIIEADGNDRKFNKWIVENARSEESDEGSINWILETLAYMVVGMSDPLFLKDYEANHQEKDPIKKNEIDISESTIYYLQDKSDDNQIKLLERVGEIYLEAMGIGDKRITYTADDKTRIFGFRLKQVEDKKITEDLQDRAGLLIALNLHMGMTNKKLCIVQLMMTNKLLNELKALIDYFYDTPEFWITKD